MLSNFSLSEEDIRPFELEVAVLSSAIYSSWDHVLSPVPTLNLLDPAIFASKPSGIKTPEFSRFILESTRTGTVKTIGGGLLLTLTLQNIYIF